MTETRTLRLLATGFFPTKPEQTESPKSAITVYALDGQEVRAIAELTGFPKGLAALDKRRAKP